MILLLECCRAKVDEVNLCRVQDALRARLLRSLRTYVVVKQRDREQMSETRITFPGTGIWTEL